MIALTAIRHPHPTGKLLQIARHRVLRWFRPAEAELRRARTTQPHPLPNVAAAGAATAKESRDEQPA